MTGLPIRSADVPRALSAARPIRTIIPWAVVTALLTSTSPFVPAATTAAAEALALPFPGGLAVRIIQGYNGGTHQGRSRYGLDLVLADGSTSGAEVVSPIDGSVTWAQGPGTGNGCMAIAFSDGSYSVTLCHVLFHRAYRYGESIARGQSLGTVGPAGTVGNAGTPHVHLELHRGGRSNSPVPFSPPEGLPLEGVELPASGGFGEHGRRAPIMSTNRPGSGAVLAASTLPVREEQPTTIRMAAPQQTAAAAPPSQGRPSQPSSAATAVRAPAAARAGVVHGTGSCLKVRKEPSADAPAVECLPDGAEVSLAPAAGGAERRWRQVEGRGWVAGEYLKRTRAVVAGTDACLNVRAEPSAQAPALGCLPEGTSVTIVDGPTSADGFDWYRIERGQPSDKGGWVAGQYLD